MNRSQYLSCIVDEHGLDVDPTKIQVILGRLALTTLIDLRNFLVFANFCPKFMLGFSCIAWPLNQVTKGGCKAKFVWEKLQ